MLPIGGIHLHFSVAGAINVLGLTADTIAK